MFSFAQAQNKKADSVSHKIDSIMATREKVYHFDIPESKVPAFFEMIDNSSSSHLIVKYYQTELYSQYKYQDSVMRIKPKP